MFKSYAEDFQNFVTANNNSRGITIPEQIVEDFISENADNYDVETLSKSTQTITIHLDDENSIMLNGIGIVVKGVEEVEVTPERIEKGAVDPSMELARNTKNYTPVKSYYYAIYALLLGQELYRITQEAQFTYDGDSVEVNYSDGYYEKGFLSIWQVSDFEDSKESTLSGSARVKSSANFHYGFEIDGTGLIIQDIFCWVDARCTV